MRCFLGLILGLPSVSSATVETVPGSLTLETVQTSASGGNDLIRSDLDARRVAREVADTTCADKLKSTDGSLIRFCKAYHYLEAYATKKFGIEFKELTEGAFGDSEYYSDLVRYAGLFTARVREIGTAMAEVSASAKDLKPESAANIPENLEHWKEARYRTQLYLNIYNEVQLSLAVLQDRLRDLRRQDYYFIEQIISTPNTETTTAANSGDDSPGEQVAEAVETPETAKVVDAILKRLEWQKDASLAVEEALSAYREVMLQQKSDKPHLDPVNETKLKSKTPRIIAGVIACVLILGAAVYFFVLNKH